MLTLAAATVGRTPVARTVTTAYTPWYVFCAGGAGRPGFAYDGCLVRGSVWSGGSPAWRCPHGSRKDGKTVPVTGGEKGGDATLTQVSGGGQIVIVTRAWPKRGQSVASGTQLGGAAQINTRLHQLAAPWPWQGDS